MRMSHYSLAFSLLFHCALIILLYTLIHPGVRHRAHTLIRIHLAPPPEEKTQTRADIPVSDRPETSLSADTPVQPASPPAERAVQLRPDTLPWSRAAAASQQAQPLTQAYRDSVLKKHALDWRNDIAALSKIKNPENPVSEMLKKQNDGSNPLFFTPGSGVKKKKKQPAPKFNFIPTTEQVQAIATLSEAGISSQIDLYASLDSTAVTTAAQFNRSLEQLYKKGFLKRKKISPENILQVVTPVGSVPLEMSRKNRINPVWQYELNISKSRLIDYLQSRLETLRHRKIRSPRDSADTAVHIKELQEKIILLI